MGVPSRAGQVHPSSDGYIRCAETTEGTDPDLEWHRMEYVPAKRKRFWRADGSHVDVIDHPSFHPDEGHSETEPEHIALQKQIADLNEDIADEVRLLDALRARAVQAMMEQIATPEEREAMKVVQKTMKKIEKLTEKMK